MSCTFKQGCPCPDCRIHDAETLAIEEGDRVRIEHIDSCFECSLHPESYKDCIRYGRQRRYGK